MQQSEDLKKLDLWLAEHVMGYKLVEDDPDYHPYRLVEGRKVAVGLFTFNPTQDSLAALMILEQCRIKCGEVIIGTGNEQYEVKVCNPHWTYGYGDTIPIAICKLAKQVFKDNEKQ